MTEHNVTAREGIRDAAADAYRLAQARKQAAVDLLDERTIEAERARADWLAAERRFQEEKYGVAPELGTIDP
jgi:hypothetical protein